MNKKEKVLEDIQQVQQYLVDYPAVKGGECANWAQVIKALGAIHRVITEDLESRVDLLSQCCESPEGKCSEYFTSPDTE